MQYFVQYAEYNNERVDFDQKSRPILQKGRAIPFYSGFGEDKFEKQFLEKMKTEGFKENDNQALKWLRSIFPEVNVKHEKVKGLAEFFAFKLGMRLGREIYRRRSCLLYWMQERLSDISKLLSTNTMTVCCNGKLYKMVPPLQLAAQSPLAAQPAQIQAQLQPIAQPTQMQAQLQPTAQPTQITTVSQNEFAFFDTFNGLEEDTAEFTELADFDYSFTF